MDGVASVLVRIPIGTFFSYYAQPGLGLVQFCEQCYPISL